MIRFLIYFGLVYFAFKGAKSWVLDIMSPQTISGQSRNEISDIMVQDPFCKIYFPKREGFPLNVRGDTLYFCSTECRHKFLESK